jgi:hypothetical protein
MAEEGTLAINADVVKAAGVNVSATSIAEAYTNVYIKEAEGYLCLATRYDWVTNIASVSTIGKEILRDAVASYAAIKAINYDMSGFSSRQEALMRVNILWAVVMEIVRMITKESDYKNFILDGAGDIN